MRRAYYVIASVLILMQPALAEPNPTKPTNRLAQESSPYLLQHAHNPVNWYPWGNEAFEAARKEGKLVFLSIGYSSCHWCHVMERESFENPEVAKLLNDSFVSVKVDREERPDIDTIYMTALNIQGERGGWPLSMFLTAEGKPIVGGTYWPPEDSTFEGKRALGFKSIVSLVHRWQTQKPKELEEQATRLAEATKSALAEAGSGKALVELNRALVDGAVKDVRAEFDPEQGGFGSPARAFRGSKFPQPSYLLLLLQQSTDGLDPALTVTIDHMARGGIYDQIGGGFHRYSTERTWTVPHFEKMLYDNAQLVEVYARAYAKSNNPSYRRVVDETLAFVNRELTSPNGGFYSALDADSAGVEGQFYVWTPQELDQALSKDDADLIKRVYGLDMPPNFEEKNYILVLRRPLADIAKELQTSEAKLLERLAGPRQKLLETRGKRARPFLDTKILAAWNGQMIAAYALAGRILGNGDYIQKATRAADFVLKKLRTADGRLLRTYGASPDGAASARLNAYVDDYAFLIRGLLCLHDATGADRWLDEARALTDKMVRLFDDRDAGGFYYTSADHEKLFARSKDQYDYAQPAGNSIATEDLVRLWQKTHDARYRELAQKNLKAFAGSLKSNPTGLTAMASALSLYLDQGPVQKAEALPAQELLAQADGPRKSDRVVKISAKALPEKPGPDGKQEVTITLNIEEGWHLYANPPGLGDLDSVATTVEIGAQSKPAEVTLSYPKGDLVNDPIIGKYFVYEKEAVVKAKVKRAPGDNSPLEIAVKFQSCNEKQCLLPATKKITIP
jgi:uncharacterized protein YyaL (SSP411 family)